jgi:hypothetical protein
MAITANPFPCPLKPNIVAPVSCWDHVSHKGFAPLLNKPSTIEMNTSKSCGKLDLYLSQIRLKFETTAIDSNLGIKALRPANAGFRRCDNRPR